MTRVLILTRRFEYGGAERQLVALANGLDKTRFSITIAPFYDDGPLLQDVERIQGVQVVHLHKKGRWDLLPFFWRLWRTVVRIKPHIMYGYMGVANQLALLAGRLVRAQVVWGVRASNMDLDRYDLLMKILYRFECWAARFPDLIISNSLSGKSYHSSHGFPEDKIVVIPNGIDTERFVPSPILREKLRAEWGLTEKEMVIGLVARLDPMKDHPTFLRAAALLIRERPDSRFVCVGDGVPSYRMKLHDLGAALGLTGYLKWVGFKDDMAAVYNALDIACSSSSFGEGFSNTVGEAMACGVPCVVTDVGDSKWIVGNTGAVVETNNATALCSAWSNILEAGPARRAELSQQSRARIVQHFSLERLIEDTTKVLQSLGS